METYCIKEEMNKQWNKEEYLEVAEKQHERISQKDDEYTEFLCWILEQRDWGYDIMIIKGKEYDRFMESDEEIDMQMKIIEAKDFYKEFRKISNIDIMNENNFVSMKYISRNDINLIVNDNGINKRFVIGIVG